MYDTEGYPHWEKAAGGRRVMATFVADVRFVRNGNRKLRRDPVFVRFDVGEGRYGVSVGNAFAGVSLGTAGALGPLMAVAHDLLADVHDGWWDVENGTFGRRLGEQVRRHGDMPFMPYVTYLDAKVGDTRVTISGVEDGFALRTGMPFETEVAKSRDLESLVRSLGAFGRISGAEAEIDVASGVTTMLAKYLRLGEARGRQGVGG